eukprot:scaffold89158_cov34-Phaeocystis_antarctica.AAC.1
MSLRLRLGPRVIPLQPSELSVLRSEHRLECVARRRAHSRHGHRTAPARRRCVAARRRRRLRRPRPRRRAHRCHRRSRRSLHLCELGPEVPRLAPRLCLTALRLYTVVRWYVTKILSVGALHGALHICPDHPSHMPPPRSTPARAAVGALPSPPRPRRDYARDRREMSPRAQSPARAAAPRSPPGEMPPGWG